MWTQRSGCALAVGRATMAALVSIGAARQTSLAGRAAGTSAAQSTSNSKPKQRRY